MWVENSTCFIEINHPIIGDLMINLDKINSIQCDGFGITIITDEETWNLNFPTDEEKLKSFKSLRDCLFGK